LDKQKIEQTEHAGKNRLTVKEFNLEREAVRGNPERETVTVVVFRRGRRCEQLVGMLG
jgi:hypothetical protein